MTDIIDLIRAATPYISFHRGKTFVLTIRASGLSDDPNFERLPDINLLSTIGVRLVIVLDYRAESQPLEPIDEHTRKEILDHLSFLRYQLESKLSKHITAVSGSFYSAMPYGVIDGQDMLYAGKPRTINQPLIQNLLNDDHVVIVSPYAMSLMGAPLILDPIELARDIAIKLSAEKLIFEAVDPLTTNTQSIERNGKSKDIFEFDQKRYNAKTSSNIEASNDNDVVSKGSQWFFPSKEWSLQEAKHYIDVVPSVKQQPFYNEFEALTLACERGVGRSHFLYPPYKGVLLKEIFTQQGQGTLISKVSRHNIRKALPSDVQEILALTQPLEQKGILKSRTPATIEKDIDDFYVLDIDNAVGACAGLKFYEENISGVVTKSAEIFSVVVKPELRKFNNGELMMQFLLHNAKVQGSAFAFLFTTQTKDWFMKQGFSTYNLKNLPLVKQEAFDKERNSSVLAIEF